MSCYKVVEKNAAEEIVNVRVIVSPTPAQAIRFASRNRFAAHAMTAMELAEAVGQGYAIETATAEKPAEPTPPAGAAAV